MNHQPRASEGPLRIARALNAIAQLRRRPECVQRADGEWRWLRFLLADAA